MVLYDGGPPAVYGLGTPDQGAGQGPSWPLGQLVEINSNTQGFSALPTHCLPLSAGFFAFAVLANVIKDVLPPRYARYVPLPTAMAVPFLVGASFAIDMAVGTVVVFAWQRVNGNESTLLVPAVASGLICGDGIWTFPSSLLSLAKIKPPMCLKFTPGS